MKMLKWNGKGVIEGVPARDLTEAEVRWYGGEAWLLKSGFYDPSTTAQDVMEKKAVYQASENKAVYGANENK